MSLVQSLISRSGGIESSEMFWRKLAGSPFCARRLEHQRTLRGHHGCVNTLSFSHDGQILVSGSDDQDIILWTNWNLDKSRYDPQSAFRYNTQHKGNIFQARFIGNNNSSFSSKLISSAADGHIKLHTITPCGSHISSQTIAGHQGMVHGLSLVPEDDNLVYSCGEDGVVQRIDLRTQQAGHSGTPLFRCSTPAVGTLKLHSIHCNPTNSRQFCLGGEDECVRIFDIRMIKRRTKSMMTYTLNPKLGDDFMTQLVPRSMWLLGCTSMRYHRRIMPQYQVTHATFSRQGDVLASYNDEDIYLFSKEAVLQGGVCGDALPMDNDDDYRNMSPSMYGPPPSSSPSSSSREEEEEEEEEGRDANDYEPRERAGLPVDHPAQRFQDPPLHSPRNEASSSDNEDTDGTLRRRLSMGDGNSSSSSSSGGNLSSFHTSTDEEEEEDESDEGNDDYYYYYQPPPQQQGVVQRYHGHVNKLTIKGVGFYGPNDEWIVSGSDCGHVFLWKRDDDSNGNSNDVGRKRRPDMILKASSTVVNCVVAPPMYSTGSSSSSSSSVRGGGYLVTSGMSHDIKVWCPGDVTEEEERKRRVVKRMKVNVERRRRERERERDSEEEEED